MTTQWIGFWVVAICLFFGMIAFTAAVIGVYRFGFVMNRLHAAGIGDTLGLFMVAVSLLLSLAPGLDTWKLVLIVVFLWFTSPASSHFLSQIEYYTNPHLYKYVDREMKELGD